MKGKIKQLRIIKGGNAATESISIVHRLIDSPEQVLKNTRLTTDKTFEVELLFNKGGTAGYSRPCRN